MKKKLKMEENCEEKLKQEILSREKFYCKIYQVKDLNSSNNLC